jgi:hypothetical protein
MSNPQSEFLEQLGMGDADPVYESEEDSGVEVAPESIDEEIVVEDAAVPEMSEVEKRLQKAVLYQQWASGNLYDQKTQSTVEVEGEFREFALNQLNKLIGIQQDAAVKSDLFDDAEVAALKGLAQMVIKNPALIGGKKAVQETAKPVAKAPIKVVKKVEPIKVTPKPAEKPKLRRQEVPQEIAQQPTVVKKPVIIQPKTQQLVGSMVQSKGPRCPQFYQDGTTVEEGGKTYSIKWAQTSAEAYGPAEEIRLTNMKPKTCLLLKDGMTVYRTEGDEFFKIVKMDKTPRVRPVEAVPFPSNMTFATMAASEAGAQAVNNRFIGSIRSPGR